MAKTPVEYEEYVTLTRTGLTPNGCTINRGGYAKIGNLVIINLRITKTASGQCTVSGFPAYASSGDNFVALTAVDVSSNNSPLGCIMRVHGEITITSSSSSGTFAISGCYICE